MKEGRAGQAGAGTWATAGPGQDSPPGPRVWGLGGLAVSPFLQRLSKGTGPRVLLLAEFTSDPLLLCQRDLTRLHA